MPAKRSKSLRSRFLALKKRTGIVWAIFIGAMTLVTGLLAMHKGAQAPRGFLLTSVDLGPQRTGESIFHLAQPLAADRWTGIVIHHLAEPAGDAESVTRMCERQNIKGLGYHFLIGNGNGLGDGLIHVGSRWNLQQPGAHVVGRTNLAAEHNQHSIGICLIGNGDRRPFTDQQLSQLITLVQQLQAQFDIPADHVHLHRDLCPQTTSPGKYFPAAQFREQLLD